LDVGFVVAADAITKFLVVERGGGGGGGSVLRSFAVRISDGLFGGCRWSGRVDGTCFTTVRATK
jgi:hypothetical protein